VVGIAEFHKAEALRRAAGALGGDVGGDEGAERNGQIVELRVRDLLGEIAYVQFHWKLLPAMPAVLRHTYSVKENWRLRGVSPEVLT
jgi:hypothetical protein